MGSFVLLIVSINYRTMVSKRELFSQVPGNPTCVTLLNRTGGYSGEEVVYGTSDGQLGVISIGRSNPDHGWSHSNELGRGGVTCIDFYNIYGPDEPSCMIVGRDDGYVEVFTLSDFEDPKIVFSFCANESVTGVRGERELIDSLSSLLVTQTNTRSIISNRSRSFFFNLKFQVYCSTIVQ